MESGQQVHQLHLVRRGDMLHRYAWRCRIREQLQLSLQHNRGLPQADRHIYGQAPRQHRTALHRHRLPVQILILQSAGLELCLWACLSLKQVQ